MTIPARMLDAGSSDVYSSFFSASFCAFPWPPSIIHPSIHNCSDHDLPTAIHARSPVRLGRHVPDRTTPAITQNG
ncbi:hypothetical protein MY11210_002145 [Beauveria gryllotalpidicola]